MVEPKFSVSEDNVLSIINYLRLLEGFEFKKANPNLSDKEISRLITKKYTEGECSTLSRLIRHLVPDIDIYMTATVDEKSYSYYTAYHYLVGLPDKNNNLAYYDINGKVTAERLKIYSAKILNNADPKEVCISKISSGGQSFTTFPHDNAIMTLLDTIKNNPRLITSGVFLKDDPCM